MWRKKVRKLSPIPPFRENEDESTETEDVDWLTASKRKAGGLLEDKTAKAARLVNEGLLLAEKKSYRQAISKWQESVQLNPEQPEVFELKAQALLELEDDFEAVRAAEMAVKLNPFWFQARITLGRAQRNFGEIRMALNTFARAFHSWPWEVADEIFEEAREMRRLGGKLAANTRFRLANSDTLTGISSELQRETAESDTVDLNKRKYLI